MQLVATGISVARASRRQLKGLPPPFLLKPALPTGHCSYKLVCKGSELVLFMVHELRGLSCLLKGELCCVCFRQAMFRSTQQAAGVESAFGCF